MSLLRGAHRFVATSVRHLRVSSSSINVLRISTTLSSHYRSFTASAALPVPATTVTDTINDNGSRVGVAQPKNAGALKTRQDVVTVAFVAHIDHGKSSMCDALLRSSDSFRSNEVIPDRVLDSEDLERERGITINASCASLMYKGVKVQILDTPGHVDFGGEVERVLNMTDGVLLLVDSVEGPKPQTRFVLKKAIELNKPISLIVNKMDRDNARPDFVINSTFDLMIDLNANDDQMDFRTAYASAIKRQSGSEPQHIADNMDAIFDLILAFPRPKVDTTAPLQMQVNNVSYDDFKGRLASGRITAGSVRKGMNIAVAHPEKENKGGKVTDILMYDKLGNVSVDTAVAGDIVQISGIAGFEIGDTICCADSPEPLPPITVEEPTVRMAFMVNKSEFAGQEGKFVTSRNIKARLEKELERNVGLRLDLDRSTADCFEVCGRGTLHLTILIETMRREGYEFMIGPPTVITKKDPDSGKLLEPFELFEVEVGEQYMGNVVDVLNRRKGEMVAMGEVNSQNMTSVKYSVPTRGLLGVKNALLSITRGTAIMNSTSDGYKAWVGDLGKKENGSLLAFETGKATSYGLENAQTRGKLLVKGGDKVYKHQVVGIHQRPGDLPVNVCKVKQLTNHRSVVKEAFKVMQGTLEFSLDDAIEYLGLDEVAEVTPRSVRLSKRAGYSYGNKNKNK